MLTECAGRRRRQPRRRQADTTAPAAPAMALSTLGLVAAVLLQLATVAPLGVEADVFTIGALIPYTGGWPVGPVTAGALSLAVEELNAVTDEAGSLLHGHTLEWFWEDSQCSPGQALSGASKLHGQHPVDVFIGPGCSVGCEPTSLLANVWGLSVVSWGCASGALSLKDTYPNFARTLGPFKLSWRLALRLCKHFEWTKVGVISSSEALWATAANVYSEQLPANGVDVDVQLFDPANPKAGLLREQNKAARIFFIFCYKQDCRDIMLEAQRQGMAGAGYAYFGAWFSSDFPVGENGDGLDELARVAFQGTMTMQPRTPNDANFAAFQASVAAQMAGDPWNDPLEGGQTVPGDAGLLYDAVYLYAHALDRIITAGGDPRDLAQILDAYNAVSFTGVAGPVSLNDDLDNEGDYEVQNFVGDTLVSVLDYFALSDSLSARTDITWPGGGNAAPPSVPTCGFAGELCTAADDGSGFPVYAIVIVAVVCVAAVAVAVVIGMMRVNRRRLDLHTAEMEAKNLGMLDASELHFDEQIGKGAYGEVYRGRFRGAEVAIKKIIINLDEITRFATEVVTGNDSSSRGGTASNSRGTNSDSRDEIPSKQILANVATSMRHAAYDRSSSKISKGSKNVDRLIKETVEEEVAYLKEQMMDEIRLNASLRHPNIVLYMGAVETPDLALVTEFLARGALTDILRDARHDKFVLTWMRKLHFALDAARGMDFLHHQPVPVLHCDLKSQNLLVGALWEVKVADFGLSMAAVVLTEEGRIGSLRWMSPEVLRGERYDSKSDVFSYGIVMHEIASERLPYHDQPSLNTKEVMGGLRPWMPPELPAAYRDLAARCSAGDSGQRPEFDEVVKLLDLHMKEELTGVLDRKKRSRSAVGFAAHVGKSVPVTVCAQDGHRASPAAAAAGSVLLITRGGVSVAPAAAAAAAATGGGEAAEAQGKAQPLQEQQQEGVAVEDLEKEFDDVANNAANGGSVCIPHEDLAVVGRCMPDGGSAGKGARPFRAYIEWSLPGCAPDLGGNRAHSMVVAFELEAEAALVVNMLTDCMSAPRGGST